MADPTVDSEAQVFERMRSAGEKLQAGLWRQDDLDTLHFIAQDVVALEAKTQLALKGKPGWFPEHPLPIDPVKSPPVTVHPLPIATTPPVHPGPILLPLSASTLSAVGAPQPLAQAAPDHAEAIARAAPTVPIDRLFMFPPIPPDPARAAMYRAAAERALDAAANLALIRVQAQAPSVDQLKGQFISDVWKGLSDVLPGLSSTASTTPSSN